MFFSGGELSRNCGDEIYRPRCIKFKGSFLKDPLCDLFICIYTCMYVCIDIHTYIHMYMYVCIFESSPIQGKIILKTKYYSGSINHYFLLNLRMVLWMSSF